MFDTAKFSPAIAQLLAAPRIMELGPGSPNRTAHGVLAAMTPENAFSKLRDRSMAMACIAGLWLYHDFLDESHAISQDLDNPTGSYWHALMHRREPDSDNSNYWFRRVRHHTVFDLLTEEYAAIWDPFAFVDRCEACRGSGSEEEMTCRQVQLREWQLLFEWCHQRAVG